MKKIDFLEYISKLPDDAEINFRDPNFGGRGYDIDKWSLYIEEGELLISPPYWEPLD